MRAEYAKMAGFVVFNPAVSGINFLP